MPALTMLQLAERFDPNQPLMPDIVRRERQERLEKLGIPFFDPPPEEATSWDYRVDYLNLVDQDPSDPLVRLRHHLLTSPKYTKFFLTGHKGSGKSTQLNALMTDEELRSRYLMLGINISDYLNISAATPEQFLGLLIAVVVEEIRGFKLEARLGGLPQKWVLKGLKETIKGRLPGLKLDTMSIQLFGILTAQFKESEPARDVIKDFVRSRSSEVTALLDELLDLLEVAANKEILIVVDDMDKLDASQSRNFFAMNMPVLLRPRASLVYTYPISLDRDPEFSAMRAQPLRFEVRNIRLFEDRQYKSFTPDGTKLLTAFIERRLEATFETYLDPELKSALFFYSCGNYRELARLLYHGFNTAAQLGLDRHDDRCLRTTLRIVREDYTPMLYSHRGLLAKARAIESEFEDQDPVKIGKLLDNLALVTFPNDPHWLDVHPIVGDLLDGVHSPRAQLPRFPAS